MYSPLGGFRDMMKSSPLDSSSKISRLRLGCNGAVYFEGSELHIWYLVGYAKPQVTAWIAVKAGNIFQPTLEALYW